MGLSHFVAGKPWELAQLPDRENYQPLSVPESLRVVERLASRGEWNIIEGLFQEGMGPLPRNLDRDGLVRLVVASVGGADTVGPDKRVAILKRKSEGYAVGPAGSDSPEPEDPPEPADDEVLTWFEVALVDEVGQPVGGVNLEFSAGSASASKPSNGAGTARVDNSNVSSGSVRIANLTEAIDAIEPKWSSERSGSPPTGADVVEVELREGRSTTIALKKETTKTVVLISPLTKIEAMTTTFADNHAAMKINTTDWKKDGGAHTTPEWSKGGSETRPVSYTKGTKVKLDLELQATQRRGPKEGIEVAGKASFGKLTFAADGTVRGGAAQPVTLESAKALKNKVYALDGNIAWSAKSKKTNRKYAAGSSTGHKVFVTLDTPASVAGSREEGITEKRMAASVPLVSAANSNDPHDIVSHLMGLFNHYTLRKNPAIPAEFNHPTYFNNVGGAWPMADYVNKSGECQAIVRFVHAAIKQVGCPGKADLVVVWADPDVGNGATALEATVPPGGGLSGKKKWAGTKWWYACLVDTYPVEGNIYDTTELNSHYMGLNNFEACLRFEHGGTKKYYGGGAGAYDSADEVLLAFQALAWVSFGHTAPTGNRGAKIEKVVKRWRDSSGNVI